jgi:hypothetical protein
MVKTSDWPWVKFGEDRGSNGTTAAFLILSTPLPVLLLLRPAFISPSSSIVHALLCAIGFLQVIATAVATDLNPQEQQIFNSLKFAAGQRRPFVVLDPILCRVARQKAADMANRGYYSHTDPDGHGPNWLVRQAGYTLPDYYDQSPDANNIESVNAGRASAGDAWNSWMESSGHRIHLLGENSFYAQQTSVGIGFVDVPGSQWRYYWIVITAPPSSPSISIKTPKAGQQTNLSTINVTGVTSGKPAAARVEVRLENAAGTGEWIAATGTTSWSADLIGLQPGANTIRARSLDSTGGVLDENVRSTRYVVLAPLVLQIEGNGKVSEGFAGVTYREVGRTYRITTKPGPGALFAGWTGSVVSPSATVEFVMSEGFMLTANFVENPFLEGCATYAGLSTTSAGSPALVSLRLSGSGQFSGKLKLTDFTIPLRGTFDPLGRAQVATTIKGHTISLDLTYAVNNGIPAITGTISVEGWTMPVDIAALGQPYDPSLSGRYTIVLRADPDSQPTVPQGDGFAAAKVSRSGVTVFVGQLADGTSFSASGRLSRSGTLPIFVLLYKKSGVFAGTLNFNGSSGIDGQFHWERPAMPESAAFPNGFTTANMAVGAHYAPPRPGEPVVRVAASINNARLELGDGGFSNPVGQPATLSPDNSLIVNAPALSGLSVVIKSSTGQFHGGFIHPETGSPTTFRGIVVQRENAGFGFFLANGSSGYATLEPAPEPQP